MRKKSFLVIPKNLKGKTAVVRVDFNEPIKGGKLQDSFRIHETLPTLSMLLKRGARIILLAHIEDSVTKKQLSFGPIVGQLERLIHSKISFVKEYSKSAVDVGLSSGAKIVLLENIRFAKGETDNNPVFARTLASFGDFYVNEAFSVSHREHASIVGITKYLPSYMGPLCEREVRRLSEALSPAHPFLLIVGGVKFETKFALMKVFMPKADAIFIGGALANTFLRAHGLEIGKSVHDEEAVSKIKEDFFTSKKIFFPLDARVNKGAKGKDITKIRPKESIYDIGPETVKGLIDLARLTRLIVWNGPLGYLEKGYSKSTEDLLKGLSRLKTKVILGGGDTLSVLDHMKLHKKFYHVSTGGGAMLDFLADGSLPGIEVLKK
ncbi:MAG: phosphoglycerate kinase [Patescibacteria group bacterium]